MCDVTDDCGARVGADHRSASYSLPYNSCNFVTLTAVLRRPVRAGSCPLFAHTIAQAGPVAWMQSSNEHNECLITAIM